MQKKSRFLTGLLSAVMALTLFALPATAAQTTTDAVIDADAKGSITIYKYLQTEEKKGDAGTGEQQKVDLTDGNTSTLPGAGFSIYKVWKKQDLLDYYNGIATKAQPKVEDFFEKKPDSTTEVKSYKAADLLEWVKAEKVQEEKKTSDTGKVEFTGLEVGLYLVVETTPPQSVVGAVKPFLVSIPMTRVKTDTGDANQLKQWLYDVTVYPKNTTKTARIQLFKKGVTGNNRNDTIALPGVQFQLQWYNDTSEAGDKWKDVGDPQTTSGEDGSITFEDLKKGTYRVKEIGYATGAVNKNYIIDTKATYEFIVDENGKIGYNGNHSEADDFVISDVSNSITVYNYRPDMAKQMKDRTSDSWVAASDYNVGDEIPYKITVTIPKNIAKLNTFKVTDTPNNLQYVTDSMQIVDANNDPLTANDVYTLDTATPANGFTVNFVPKEMGAYAGQTIEIQYKAKLLKDAAITIGGNLNTAKLTYSNTTATDGKGENTIEDRAVVYTFMIDVVKQDDKDNKLDGVEFDLYRQVKGTKDDVNGAVVDASKFNLEVTEGSVWVKVNKTPLVTDTNGKIILTDKQADDFTNKGLANGKYALVETKTKQDYNLLKDPIYVTLNVKYTSAWNVTETFDEKGQIKKHTEENMTQTFKDEKGEIITGTVTQTVINRKGFTLPTTGGFGTLLFSGIGALLVVGGVGVLMGTKKKKDNA